MRIRPHSPSWRRRSGLASSRPASRNRAARLERLEERTLLSGSPYGFLTGPNPGEPIQIAVDYLAAHGDDWGIAAGDLATMAITDQYTDAGGARSTHIYLRQAHNGLPVGNSVANVNISRLGEVINVGGRFVAGLAARSTGVVAAPGLTAAEALLALAPSLGLTPREIPIVAGDPQPGPAQETVLAAPSLSLDPIPAKLQYIATGDGDVALSWNFVVRTPDGDHWYDASVDASAGTVTDVNDWVAHYTAAYNVFDRPLRSPDDGPRTLVTDPADPVASPFGWHDTNGAAGPESTLTTGNNANAYEDSANANTPGLRPDGTSTLTFDFALDLSGDPDTYRPAAITNLFYWTNLNHDIHYKYGFDEASGNFQVNNYGRGGLGDDAVQAEAQDGGGTNNANFATPPDGIQPRMQMYVFDLTTPNRDGDFANEIITHEYGHGVSTRVTGGPANSNSLDALQSGGMGEGYGDYWAMVFTQFDSDTKDTRRPTGNYALGQGPNGPGVRRNPYSFDLGINPITFADFNGGFPNNEVHNSGEIWASTLWDMTWLLIEKHGYSSDLLAGYTGPGTAGNLLALQLVMDAMKLQPANPSFIEARNAILLADQALTGGQNVEAIWQAFARRGLGASAATANSDSDVITTAFDVPFLLVQARAPGGLVAGQAAANVLVGTFNDPFGSPLASLSATIDWGDGSPVSAGTIVSLGGGDYEVRGSHTYALGGNYTVTVGIADQLGHADSDSVSVPVGSEVVVTPVPLLASEGTGFTRAVATFNDSGGVFPVGAYTATIDWGDGSPTDSGTITQLAAGFQVSGSHTYRLAGIYTARVSVTRAGTGAVIGVTATITDAVITASATTFTATEGAAFTGSVATFTDANPLALVTDYTATIDWGDGSPVETGTVVAAAGGGYEVIGTHTYQGYGSYKTIVSIVSPGGLPTEVRGRGNVDDAAIHVASVPFTGTESVAFGNTLVATFTDDNPFGDLAEFSATVDWGDGVLNPATITRRPDGSYAIRSGHTYDLYGTYVVRVTVDSVGGGTATATQQVTIADAPLVPVPATLTAREGIAFTSLVGSFRDTNPNGFLGEFSARINWGDGTITDGVVTAGPGNLYNVRGGHTYDEGTFDVVAVVTSTGGSTTTLTARVVVADAPLSPSGTPFAPAEGVAFTGIAGSFRDGNPISVPGDFRATIDWGDGSPTEPGTIVFRGGRFDVEGTHTFRAGNWTVRVTVVETDGSGGTAITSAATVADAPILASPVPFTASEGVAFSGVVAHVTDSNPLGTASQLSATINWGDGQSSPGTIVAAAGGGFDVLGTHTYSFGNFPVQVTVLSEGGSQSGASSNVSVPNAPLTATALTIAPQEGRSLTANVATITDGNPSAVASEYTATITWGDGKTSPGTVLPAGAPGQFFVQGTHTYPQGTFGMVVTIRDRGGSTATASATVGVPNAALSSTGADVDAVEGTAFTARVASLQDANPSAVASEYVATIDWGDGSPQSLGTVVAAAGGGFDVRGTHTYPTGDAPIQSFPIRVTIRDAAGGTTQATTTAEVTNAVIRATGQQNLIGVEGAPFRGTLVTFTDGNTLAAAGDYTATIDWGDGTDPEPGSVSTGTGGAGFAVAGNHALPVGTFFITVTIDDGAAETVAQARIQVENAPITAEPVALQFVEGTAFTSTVATFTDGNLTSQAGDYTATIDWGLGGAASPGTIERLGDGRFRILGTFLYPDVGRFATQVTVSDGQGAPVPVVGSATVVDAPLAPLPRIISGTETLRVDGILGAFLDGNSESLGSDFAATVTWGDGTASEAVTVTKVGPGTLVLSGGHTYARAGTYAVQLSVQDLIDGGTATIASQAVIANRTYPLTGILESSSDTGASASDAITRQAQPAFSGQAEPGATVTLTATRLDVAANPVTLGAAIADALGNWRIVTGAPLADGRYLVSGAAADVTGNVSSPATTLLGGATAPLVIDTIGPHVATVITTPAAGQFTVLFQDDGGLSLGSALNRASYTLFSAQRGPRRSFPLTSLTPGATLPGGGQSVVAQFRAGRLRGGYVLRISSSGTTDLAGNILDERVYTPFPSTRRVPGSDYIAQIDVRGGTATAPRVYVPPPQVLAAQQYQQFLGNATAPVTTRRRGRR
jgi:extracellular elastinolytic metalloproteinase